MADKTVKNKKGRKRPKNKRSTFKNIMFVCLFLILAVTVAGAGYLYAIIRSTPDLDVNAVLQLSQPSRVYDSKEQFMDNVQTDEQRFVVPIDQMSPYLPKAFVSIEDERFYTHKGIDVKRIVGAAVIDVKNILHGKRGLHGASTITQQLLKNTILTNEVSIQRKVKEVYLALQLEKKLSKEQILQAYLNTIPLGGHTYGVEAAAQKYFSKSAKDLNIIESAYLAGVTQAPTLYNALTTKSKENPTPYLNRTKTVLDMMYKNNNISETEYKKAISDIDNENLAFKPSKRSDSLNFEWFSRATINQVKKDLKDKYKYNDDEVNKLIMNGGLQIYSTMDRELQNYTKEVLNNPNNFNVGNNKNEMLKDKSGKYSYPALQASASVMDYRNGEVKALVGGRGTQPPLSNNRAYTDLRPIGSTTKPLTVYSPAIDMQMMTAGTIIDDSPLSPEVGSKYPTGSGPYNPKNESGKYSGPRTLRDGLKYSINTIAVKVEDKLGLKNGLAYGEKFGLIYNDVSKESISALALGQFDGNRDGSNPFYLSAAYGTFGNDGLYTEPILYTKVIDATGKVILEKKPETRKVLSPEASYITYDMLKGPVNYSAGGAKFGNMEVVGKTGTTSGNKDLWFAGLTPYLSCSVWVGYDKPREIYGRSGTAVSPIWGKIMKKAHEGLDYKELSKPDDISNANICTSSGKLPTDGCKQANTVYNELFIDGTEPTSYCNVHIAQAQPKQEESQKDPNAIQNQTTPDPNVKKDEDTKNKVPPSNTEKNPNPNMNNQQNNNNIKPPENINPNQPNGGKPENENNNNNKPNEENNQNPNYGNNPPVRHRHKH